MEVTPSSTPYQKGKLKVAQILHISRSEGECEATVIVKGRDKPEMKVILPLKEIEEKVPELLQEFLLTRYFESTHQ